MPKLAHSLNRSILASIPAFFGDDLPRRCTLADIDSNGLWLGGEAVRERLATFEAVAPADDAQAVAFFPFTQIAYVFDPMAFASRTTRPGSDVVPPKPSLQRDAPGSDSHDNRHRETGSKHKQPKPTR